MSRKKTSLTLLFPEMLGSIDKPMNVSDEVCRWVHQNYGMSQIINILLSLNKQMHLPRCSRNFFIASTKKWMIVLKYKYECIKNMKWVESYVNFIKSKIMQLPRCPWRLLIELTKQYIIVMRYEGECIKNMEWKESYINCSKSKKCAALWVADSNMVNTLTLFAYQGKHVIIFLQQDIP